MRFSSAALPLLLGTIGLLGCRAAAAPPSITVQPIAGDSSPALAAYQVREFAVSVRTDAAPYANPFDPDEVTLDATATGPKGQTLQLPGYWSQAYQTKTAADGSIALAATDETAGWRVRLAFPTAGDWTVVVRTHDKSGDGISSPLRVAVAPPAAGSQTGFVRPSPHNKRYFALDTGASYFLIGENVGWAGKRGLADYQDWLGALGKAGGNYARVWMAFAPLESKGSGLGKYDLQNAAYFDNVLRIAQQNGIRCMLAFGTYGELATGGFFGEGQWPANPYSAANGGPVAADKPDDFFTDATARRLYRRRLRYLIARYAAYTSIGFWEFWNERSVPPAWYTEMADYVQSLDPYRHVVTNSYSTTGDAATLALPEMQLTQTHRYGDEGSIRDFVGLIEADARAHDTYGKPHLLGEFGISWRRGDEHFDPRGIGTNLHNGLWAGALSGNAGGSAIWWWDGYIHPKNLYPAFTALAGFASSIEWAQRTFEPLTLPEAPRVHYAASTASTAATTDLVLNPVGGWGEPSRTPVVIGRDGRTSGGPLPSTLMSKAKPDNYAPLRLQIDLAKASQLVLRIGTVSNKANLRISVDGKTVTDFALDAAPSAHPEFKSTQQHPEYGGIYQAVFDRDYSAAIPAGKHEITIENTDGDWASITTYTLTGAHDPGQDTLHPLALQDATTGETLVWLQDPESIWPHDADPAYAYRKLDKVALTLPVPLPGKYRVLWWDTWAAKPQRSSTAVARNGALHLTSPAFTRDVALRVVRQ